MKQISMLFCLILLSISIISCKDKKRIANLKEKKLQLPVGHTFFRVTIKNRDTVICQPCDANIAKYVIYKDSVFHNWGQENYMLNIVSLINGGNQIKLKTTYKYNNETPDGIDSTITIQQLNKKIWKINDEIFIDSLHINSIRHINQPCKEFDNCDENKKEVNISALFAINKQWSNHCEKGVDKDNIIFYSPDEIAFEISSINFICGAISKKAGNNTIELYLKESGNDYAPNGEVYSNNNLPNGIDFYDCSLTVPVAEVKLINEFNAEFKWLGFYDTKKKTRVYLKNPFTDKIEKESIILKKCDD
ncbi:hypothetical protein PQ462_00940 [Flavobacterium sp. KACC 22758]|uniref:hypothetical protein n=1 Tax=Flavobacterium sp. KACC 22758 TaxID=3025667 RepID=UPI002365CF29|nr:hypothetical protein [Flavobacterium sp. KACC 22758]WDF59946.1 hypothetical protein PQ462_00940 [Flavobacterium sp. KACC 22758]